MQLLANKFWTRECRQPDARGAKSENRHRRRMSKFVRAIVASVAFIIGADNLYQISRCLIAGHAWTKTIGNRLLATSSRQSP